MITCPNCGRIYTDKYFKMHRDGNKHRNGCNFIALNKTSIINEYKTHTLLELSERYNVRYDLLSDSLKYWGIMVRGSGTKRANKRGKWVPFNINFFDDSNDSPVKYWLIGLIAADGTVNGNRTSISQSGDGGKNLIEYVKEILESDYEISESISNFNGKTNTIYTIGFSSKQVIEKLSEYNIVPNKTYTYKFPDNIPEKNISDFLCGYLEGDGCIGCYENGGTKNFCVVQIVGTKDFIDKCAKVIPIQGRVEKIRTSSIWAIWWNGTNAILLCDWLYSSQDIYKRSKKYENYIKCKNAYLKSDRYKCLLDRNKLLEYIYKNSYVNVSDYYRANPQHSVSVYYNWLKGFVEKGLITESQYKANTDTSKEKEIHT